MEVADTMKVTMKLKEGVSFESAIKLIEELEAEHKRIENDSHTNKHYELRNGRIWKKGNATGKYWEHLCNSRDAQGKAHEMMGLR